MKFVVDCLNNTAQKELDYRTAMEKMYGSMPNKSMLQFRFWETVLYFEPIRNILNITFYKANLSGLYGIAGTHLPTRFGPLQRAYGRMAQNW
jgi:hypothetical protein